VIKWVFILVANLTISATACAAGGYTITKYRSPALNPDETKVAYVKIVSVASPTSPWSSFWSSNLPTMSDRVEYSSAMLLVCSADLPNLTNETCPNSWTMYVTPDGSRTARLNAKLGWSELGIIQYMIKTWDPNRSADLPTYTNVSDPSIIVSKTHGSKWDIEVHHSGTKIIVSHPEN